MPSITVGPYSSELGNCGCCDQCCLLDDIPSGPANLFGTITGSNCLEAFSPTTLSNNVTSYVGLSNCADAGEMVAWTLECIDGRPFLNLRSDMTLCEAEGFATSVSCDPFELVFELEQTEGGCACCASGTTMTVTITE